MKRFAALSLALLLAGCAGGPQIREYVPDTAPVELTGVPFFPQEEYQCGPAALATVLAANGVPVTPDQLTPRVYLPQRKGSLQAELVAAARHYERVPYPLAPRLGDVLRELSAGRPVLILQNFGFGIFPSWHYAVLVGYDPARNELILRSGRTQRQVMGMRRFLASWEGGEFWAMVVTAPEQIPATATVREWISTVSAFENLQQPRIAAAAYGAATRRWPDEPLTWQALGNALYASRDLRGAEQAYRAALKVSPVSAAARNNLAQVLLERGCPVAAATEIEQALSGQASEAERAVLARTRAAITAYSGPQAANCGP